jgi:hypothetical protein
MSAAIEALRAALARPLPAGELFVAHGIVMIDKGGGELDALDRDDYATAALQAAPELLAEVDRQKEVIGRLNALCDHLGMSLRDIKAERDALRARSEQWRCLYRRAVNEANGLTNYVEDRPELRRAERNLTAIETEARGLTLKEQA